MALGNDSNIFQQPLGGQVLQRGKINEPGIIAQTDPEKEMTERTSDTMLGMLTGLGNK